LRRHTRLVVVLTAMAAQFAPAMQANAVQVAHAAIVSANPADFTPDITKGQVNAIVVVGNLVVAGGSFNHATFAGGPDVAPVNILGFDATTGAISTTFKPKMANGRVYALATDGTNTFVGGTFTKTNGKPLPYLVKLDPAGKAITTFAPAITGTGVYDLVYANGLLYAGGAFTNAGGLGRTNFVALDPSTGLAAPGVNIPFTGTHNGGVSRVAKIDVSPNGSTLVAVGNFTNVGGNPRDQIALLDLAGATASVSTWSTQRFTNACNSVFDTYIRDIDISPDGSYFAVGTTGSFMGGANAGVLCDSVSRWELGRTGPSQQPTWVDYAGGDTTFSVAATGTAIYAGGHFRWFNNPYAGDTPGPGYVRRRGIAALDPVNGLPFSWDPGREQLGKGVFSLVGTADGLWVGSDTDTIGHEIHGRVAFFPLAGGKTVPPETPAVVPGELFSVPGACSGTDASILYRVNAAGPALAPLDCGPGWAADSGTTNSPYRNAGSSTASWSSVPAVNANVPATTPSQIFDSERWDPSGGTEMQWNFPAPAGTHVQVRLYFANRCTCTNTVGKRVFNVGIEGSTVLNHFDIVADTGSDKGTMKAFPVTSDGTITIDFTHVVENPLINGIELINTDVPPQTQAAAEYLLHRTFDGTAAGAPSQLATTGTDWTRARGSWLTNGRIYSFWDDGRFYSRSFNGTTVGSSRLEFLHSLTTSQLPVLAVTGTFYENGRLYYTLRGDDRLLYRYFTPESGILGAETYVASPATDGIGWGQVRGMTLASGTVYAAKADGNLYAVGWTNGAPVAGSPMLVDGTGGWAAQGMFVRS
jgi:hypothetical protein